MTSQEQEFLDWLADEEYGVSHFPSTELRDLRDRFEKSTGRALKLSLIRRILVTEGYQFEGLKAFIWQPHFVNHVKVVKLPMKPETEDEEVQVTEDTN